MNNIARQISFSWDIHYICNYRCPYCWFYGKWQNLKKINCYFSIDDWVRYWLGIYNRYGSVNIELNGGEPLLYPDLKELIKELSKIHTLNILTNLSLNIKDCFEGIDHKNIKITSTFHPAFSCFDSFLRKIKYLKEKGFVVSVSYLAYPPQIELARVYRNKFYNENIPFSLIPFLGNYNGIDYPPGYTDEEKSIIDFSLVTPLEFNRQPNKNPGEKPCCYAGQYSAVIKGDGKVTRCRNLESNGVIGDFFDENFELSNNPLPCGKKDCEYRNFGFKSNALEDVSFIKPDTLECKKNDEIFHKNKEKNIQETLERKIILDSKPLRLGIILTTWCNLECIMCSSSRYTNKLTLSSSTLTKIEELLPYLERIDWQGGEFFNFKHIKRIFYSLNKYPNIAHEIVTNGLLLDYEWVELLLGLDTCIVFSIDSPIKETYEYIREGGSFERLIENLNLIKELEEKHSKRLRKRITVVVMKSNYRHLTEFIPFVQKYGFECLNFNPVLFVDNDENIFFDKKLDLSCLNDTMLYIKDKCAELNIEFGWNLPNTCCKDDKTSEKNSFINTSDLYCNFPWKSMWICAEREGNIYPDCWCKEAIGNIFHDTLLEAWNSKMMQQYRRRIIANDTTLCNKGCINSYSAAVNSKHY